MTKDILGMSTPAIDPRPMHTGDPMGRIDHSNESGSRVEILFVKRRRPLPSEAVRRQLSRCNEELD